ncbi:AAA family ATPase [Brevibacillus laterosporus]|uniref:exonuclease V n=1 Tax=Brevibacillus phage Sundance TaxID=1691958 RepID=UPI0006BDB4C9|nr:exonuclease V [Brevibacillus phage Sundance]ALA47828.1 putative RecD/TraA family helicase [Brevibacillus phage Sundance]
MELNLIDVVLTPEKKLYYSDSSSFGIYAVRIDEAENMNEIEVNSFGNVSIKGSMPILEIDKPYIAKISPKKDPKYGMGYEVKTIYMKPVTTIEEQHKFLASILTDFQIKSISEAYPDQNVIDLIKNGTFDVSLTKGIKEATLEKIKDKILTNEKYQNAIITLTGEFGVPYSAVKKLSDKYGSPDLLVQKIRENPYILTEIDGYGFKKVDDLALLMGVEKNSPHRILSCIEYVLDEQANNGHSWMREKKAITETLSLLNIGLSEIEEVVNKNAKNGKFSTNDKKGIIYLDQNYYYEDQIKNHLKRLLASEFNHKIKDVEGKIAEVEKKQGFKFTDEQRKAIYLAIEENVLVVNGKAGTGKTSVIKGIVEVLKAVEGLGIESADIIIDEPWAVMTNPSVLEYATCALSGKASQRIQESTGLDSFTIHRLLGFHPKLGWTFNENCKLPKDIIILDEASMVNTQLFYYLLSAIKDGAKLIITGDTGQLEPIGVGNVLVDMIASGIIPSVELTLVHRQAQKSGILSCANMVRDGKKFLTETGKKRLGELQDLHTYSYEESDKVYKAVISIAKKYNENILDFQIIVPMKSRGKLSTQNINKECQKIFNQNPEDVDPRNKIERKDVVFMEDDKVIINGNNYDKGVFNGTIGIIKYINSTYSEDGKVVGEIVIDFEGIGDIRFSKEEMAQIDLAYAITVHKSQGSQWKYVVFALDYSSYVLNNRQLVYTAMTRASEGLFMPVEYRALQKAIDTDNSSKRCTFLEEMLKVA